MPDQEYPDKALRQLFSKLPQEQIPGDLNIRILQHIEKAHEARQRKKAYGLWVAVSLISVGMILLIVGIFRYLSFDFTGMFKNALPAASLSQFPFLYLYILVGIIGGVLLFIDYRLRKLFMH